MTSAVPKSAPRRTGSLQPVELAQAAVMAALCAAIAIISVVVPFAAGLSLLGTVPMGLLAYRYRLRVLIAATVAGGLVAFLIAGMGGFMTVVNCAYIGGLTGIVKRRGRGTPTVIASALVAGALFGAATVVALTILSRLRNLIFESVTANVTGVAAVLARVPGMEDAAERLKQDFATALHYWPYLFFGAGVLSIMFVSLVGWWALSRVMSRLVGVPDVHKLEASTDAGPIAPVPLQLRDVRFRYPRADHDALGPVSLSVQPGEHLAVTGANGSGKTTLMLVLSGREPTSGTVERPGAVGLGKVGGTAVVMQHPESQVLGTRVADDVVWGLPPGTSTDVSQLLSEVGLDGLAERDTGGLSGGELQRLAVAAALAREPSLLIADEVTSMVDQEGREGLMSVLSGLTQRHRTSLVHITHYNDEADAADRTVNLTGNGWPVADSAEMVETTEAPTATPVGERPR
ncbi:MAG: ATP-binding cassette domain-containing protein, partial [Mycobacterium sp.]